MSCGWRTGTAAPEHRAWLGLGTNLGDRRAILRGALGALGGLGRIDAVSSVYETEPVGLRAQPVFWNLVLRLVTSLGPAALLAAAQDIELAQGRTRPFPNAPRTLDIDLLLYDDVVLTNPGLRVPHPRLLERAFVLRPLAEVDPALRHPVTGVQILDLARALPRAPRAEPIFPGTELLPAHSSDDTQ